MVCDPLIQSFTNNLSEATLSFLALALNGYYGQPVLSLYIDLIFLYHVNQCRVQLGTNRVVVVAESIRQRQTLHTWMILYFFVFPPIFEKVVKRGSGSFEFYLLVRVITS